jgi:type III secretion system YseE family protein
MIRLTPLEEHLFADHNGTYRAQLCADLDYASRSIEQQRQNPCTAQQYHCYTSQTTAIEQARIVIDAIWCLYHETPGVGSMSADGLALQRGSV